MESGSSREAARPSWRAFALLAVLAFTARVVPVVVLGPEHYATRGYLYYE